MSKGHRYGRNSNWYNMHPNNTMKGKRYKRPDHLDIYCPNSEDFVYHPKGNFLNPSYVPGISGHSSYAKMNDAFYSRPHNSLKYWQPSYKNYNFCYDKKSNYPAQYRNNRSGCNNISIKSSSTVSNKDKPINKENTVIESIDLDLSDTETVHLNLSEDEDLVSANSSESRKNKCKSMPDISDDSCPSKNLNLTKYCSRTNISIGKDAAKNGNQYLATSTKEKPVVAKDNFKSERVSNKLLMMENQFSRIDSNKSITKSIPVSDTIDSTKCSKSKDISLKIEHKREKPSSATYVIELEKDTVEDCKIKNQQIAKIVNIGMNLSKSMALEYKEKNKDAPILQGNDNDRKNDRSKKVTVIAIDTNANSLENTAKRIECKDKSCLNIKGASILQGSDAKDKGDQSKEQVTKVLEFDPKLLKSKGAPKTIDYKEKRLSISKDVSVLRENNVDTTKSQAKQLTAKNVEIDVRLLANEIPKKIQHKDERCSSNKNPAAIEETGTVRNDSQIKNQPTVKSVETNVKSLKSKDFPKIEHKESDTKKQIVKAVEIDAKLLKSNESHTKIEPNKNLKNRPLVNNKNSVIQETDAVKNDCQIKNQPTVKNVETNVKSLKSNDAHKKMEYKESDTKKQIVKAVEIDEKLLKSNESHTKIEPKKRSSVSNKNPAVQQTDAVRNDCQLKNLPTVKSIETNMKSLKNNDAPRKIEHKESDTKKQQTVKPVEIDAKLLKSNESHKKVEPKKRSSVSKDTSISHESDIQKQQTVKTVETDVKSLKGYETLKKIEHKERKSLIGKDTLVPREKDIKEQAVKTIETDVRVVKSKEAPKITGYKEKGLSLNKDVSVFQECSIDKYQIKKQVTKTSERDLNSLRSKEISKKIDRSDLRSSSSKNENKLDNKTEQLDKHHVAKHDRLPGKSDNITLVKYPKECSIKKSETMASEKDHSIPSQRNSATIKKSEEDDQDCFIISSTIVNKESKIKNKNYSLLIQKNLEINENKISMDKLKEKERQESASIKRRSKSIDEMEKDASIKTNISKNVIKNNSSVFIENIKSTAKQRSKSCINKPSRLFTHEEIQRLDNTLADLESLDNTDQLDETIKSDMEVSEIMSNYEPPEAIHDNARKKAHWLKRGKSCTLFDRTNRDTPDLGRSKSWLSKDILCYVDFRITRSISKDWLLSSGLDGKKRNFQELSEAQKKPAQVRKRRKTVGVCEAPSKRPCLFSEQTPYVKPSEIEFSYTPRYQDEDLEQMPLQQNTPNITVVYSDMNPKDPRRKSGSKKINFNGRDLILYNSLVKENESREKKQEIYPKTDIAKNMCGRRKSVSRRNNDPDYVPNEKVTMSCRTGEFTQKYLTRGALVAVTDHDGSKNIHKQFADTSLKPNSIESKRTLSLDNTTPNKDSLKVQKSILRKRRQSTSGRINSELKKTNSIDMPILIDVMVQKGSKRTLSLDNTTPNKDSLKVQKSILRKRRQSTSGRINSELKKTDSIDMPILIDVMVQKERISTESTSKRHDLLSDNIKHYKSQVIDASFLKEVVTPLDEETYQISSANTFIEPSPRSNVERVNVKTTFTQRPKQVKNCDFLLSKRKEISIAKMFNLEQNNASKVQLTKILNELTTSLLVIKCLKQSQNIQTILLNTLPSSDAVTNEKDSLNTYYNQRMLFWSSKYCSICNTMNMDVYNVRDFIYNLYQEVKRNDATIDIREFLDLIHLVLAETFCTPSNYVNHMKLYVTNLIERKNNRRRSEGVIKIISNAESTSCTPAMVRPAVSFTTTLPTYTSGSRTHVSLPTSFPTGTVAHITPVSIATTLGTGSSNNIACVAPRPTTLHFGSSTSATPIAPRPVALPVGSSTSVKHTVSLPTTLPMGTPASIPPVVSLPTALPTGKSSANFTPVSFANALPTRTITAPVAFIPNAPLYSQNQSSSKPVVRRNGNPTKSSTSPPTILPIQIDQLKSQIYKYNQLQSQTKHFVRTFMTSDLDRKKRQEPTKDCRQKKETLKILQQYVFNAPMANLETPKSTNVTKTLLPNASLHNFSSFPLSTPNLSKPINISACDKITCNDASHFIPLPNLNRSSQALKMNNCSIKPDKEVFTFGNMQVPAAPQAKHLPPSTSNSAPQFENRTSLAFSKNNVRAPLINIPPVSVIDITSSPEPITSLPEPQNVELNLKPAAQRSDINEEFVDLEKYFDNVNHKEESQVSTEVIDYSCNEIPCKRRKLSDDTNGDPIPRNASNDSGLDSPNEIDMEMSSFENRICLCGEHAVYVCPCREMMYCSSACQHADWQVHKQTAGHHKT